MPRVSRRKSIRPPISWAVRIVTTAAQRAATTSAVTRQTPRIGARRSGAGLIGSALVACDTTGREGSFAARLGAKRLGPAGPISPGRSFESSVAAIGRTELDGHGSTAVFHRGAKGSSIPAQQAPTDKR